MAILINRELSSTVRQVCKINTIFTTNCGFFLSSSLALTLSTAFVATAQPIVPAVDGTGTIVTPNGNSLDITGGAKSGDGANLFHSFTEFGVQQGQIANFISRPDIVNILARINGGNVSYINGLIQVTGGNSNLFLLNPSGIIFGANASLNVPAAFTATTANGVGFGNNWFSVVGNNNYAALVGKINAFAFTMQQPGSIINAGNLAVGSGQDLNLIGGTVINTGQLSAPGGNITIAAVPGESLVRLSQSGYLLSLEIEPIGNNNNLLNNWNLPISSLPQMLTGGNGGNATGITVNQDGSIQLTGSGIRINEETTIVSGNINVSGATGGQVNILGDKVGVINANINASGINGGGNVRIGGDYKGEGNIPNSSVTFISPNSTIEANAIDNGSGGKVIIWSKLFTRVHGNISVRGGSISGNGGFVETSSRGNLDITTVPDLSATLPFKGGTWLIDPNNIVIVSGLGNSNIDDTDIFVSKGNTSTLGVDLILDALKSGDVIISTEADSKNINSEGGNIILAAKLDYNGIGTGKTLTFNAHNNILINNSILDSNPGNDSLSLVLNGNSDSDNIGFGFVKINAPIFTQGGNITIKGDGEGSNDGIRVGSSLESGGGNINLTGTGGANSISNGISIEATTINSGGGDINLTASTKAGSVGIRNQGNIKSGSGNITLTSDNIFLDNTSGSSQISGTGKLVLQPLNPNLNITLGGNSSGAEIGNLNGSELASLVPGFDTIMIGRDNSSGVITLAGDVTFNDPVILRSPEGSGSINTSNFTINGVNKARIELLANQDIKTGNIINQGREIIINSKSGSIDTTAGKLDTSSLSGGGGAISLNAASNIITGNIYSHGSQSDNIVVSNASSDSSSKSVNGVNKSSINNSNKSNDFINKNFNNNYGNTTNKSGNITLISTQGSIDTSQGVLDATSSLISDSISSNGGVIRLEGKSNITTGNISTYTNSIGDGGDIIITSKEGDINTTQGSLETSSLNGKAGAISLKAAKNISTANINTSAEGNGKASSITITSNSGEISTIQGTLNASSKQGKGGDIQLTSPTKISANGVVSTGESGTGDIVFTTNQINFTGAAESIKGNGNFTLQPYTENQNLEISAENFNVLADGFTSIIIGKNNGSGIINFKDNITFKDPIIIQSPQGSIAVNGDITGIDNASINISGATILNADITTSNQNITINGDTTIANNASLSTGATGSGDIMITGKIDGNNNLTLETGKGDILLKGDIGSINPLGNLNINSANNVDTNAITAASITQTAGSGKTTFSGQITTNSDSGINLEGTNFTLNNPVTTTNKGNLVINNSGTLNISQKADINLDGSFNQIGTGEVITQGDITTANQDIKISSPVTLAGEVNFNLGTATISFGSTLAAGNNPLTLTAGEINFVGAVTGTNNLILQPATASQNITIGANENNSNALDLTAAEINSLQGNFSSITIGSKDSSGDISIANNVNFNSPVTIQSPAESGTITAKGEITAPGTSIELKADGNIIIGDIISNGGNITLQSKSGLIESGNLIAKANTQGGNITLLSPVQITTGKLDSSANLGNGGNVLIDPELDIEVGYINAQGGSAGTGGKVDITTARYFRVTNSFKDNNGIEASISTAGGKGGGEILIRHGGGEIASFNVAGNATINGTVGNITTGTESEQTVKPGPYFGPFSQGQTQVITKGSSQVPSNPNIPNSPQIPSTPNISNPPQIPQIPEIPDTSEIPAIRNTSQTQDISQIPVTPQTPQTSDKSNSSQIPNTTSISGTQNSSQIPNTTPISGTPNSSEIPNITPISGTENSSQIPNTPEISGTQNSSQIPHITPISGTENSSQIPNTTPISGTENSSQIPNTTPISGTPNSSQTPNITEISGTPNSSQIVSRLQTPQTQRPDTSNTPQKLFLQSQENIISIDTEDINISTPQVENRSVTAKMSLDTTAVLRENIFTALKRGNLEIAVPEIEKLRRQEYENYLGEENIPANSPASLSLEQVQGILKRVSIRPGKKPAILYVFVTPQQLNLVLVTPSSKPILKSIPAANQDALMQVVKEFRTQVTDGSKTHTRSYLPAAHKLYQWLIAPVESELQSQGIETIAFSLDPGLRAIPLAALHDGQRFLVQKYSLGLIPSVNLVDTRYEDIKKAQVLAMGASRFEQLTALPAVPIELFTIAKNLWKGKVFINEEFTLENLKSQRSQEQFGIIHLATHAEFRPGLPNRSFIQLWNRQLRGDELRQIGWHQNPTIELLVLSACRTAVGDEQAELGFGGLAVSAGVKSALASLWYVSDQGTLALMSEFYENLKTAPIKAEALQQAQIAMINGEVRIEKGKLLGVGAHGDGISLPPELADVQGENLSHPFYWSAFTMIGSPW